MKFLHGFLHKTFQGPGVILVSQVYFVSWCLSIEHPIQLDLFFFLVFQHPSSEVG